MSDDPDYTPMPQKELVDEDADRPVLRLGRVDPQSPDADFWYEMRREPVTGQLFFGPPSFEQMIANIEKATPATYVAMTSARHDALIGTCLDVHNLAIADLQRLVAEWRELKGENAD
jgi:hypothetical protein